MWYDTRSINKKSKALFRPKLEAYFVQNKNIERNHTISWSDKTFKIQSDIIFQRLNLVKNNEWIILLRNIKIY